MWKFPLMRRLAWLVLVLPLAGCQQVLFSKLTEQQANEVLAALAETRIDASKEKVGDQHWAVSVKSSRLGEALVYLRDRGLPVQPSPTMGEVFKKDGMISTPTEERARYAWALQESIAATLRRIDGVTEARVHVALPQNDPLSDKPLPSSASVFIKHRQTLDVNVIAPQVKSMVMASVEGLDYRNISLFAYPVDARPLPQPVQRATLQMSSGDALQPSRADAGWHWFMLGGLSLAGFVAFLYDRRSGRPVLGRVREAAARVVGGAVPGAPQHLKVMPVPPASVARPVHQPGGGAAKAAVPAPAPGGGVPVRAAAPAGIFNLGVDAPAEAAAGAPTGAATAEEPPFGPKLR